MATQQDIIKDFMRALDNTNATSAKDAVDEAFRTASGGRFNTMQDVIDAFLVDCSDSSRSVEDFLREECGIILDNEDTGAITGFDAGGTKIKTDESIVLESGNLYNFTGNFFTTKGLTVKLGNIPYNGNSATPSDLSYTNIKNDPTKNYIWQAFKTWWASSALDLIAESYGDNYGFTSSSSATTKTMYFGFFNEAADKDGGITLAITAKPGNVLAMAVNMEAYSSLIIDNESEIDNKDGKLKNRDSSYLDRTLAHEFTHAVMKATIDNFGTLPQFIKEGMAELTHGIDDERTDTIKKLAKDPNSLEAALNINDTGTGTNDAYAAGYMLLRYFAKQCADENFVTAPTRTIANQTITTIDENGQRITANNGTALVTAGDTLKTDVDNNIVEIAIGRADNIISTPEGETPVIVKNSAGKVLASIIGSASVHENGYIHKNLSDIKVSSTCDEITAQGGNGNDSFTISGYTNIVLGDNGNDFFTIKGIKNSVGGGDGNDSFTVSGFINIVSGDNGNDSFIISGKNTSVSGGDGTDTSVFTAEARNNTLDLLEDIDLLKLETSDISAEKKQLVEDSPSIVITSGKDTLLVIEYTEEGWEAAENILLGGGEKITSIEELLWGELPPEQEFVPPSETTYTETLPGADDENNDLRNGRDTGIGNIVTGTKNNLVIEGLGGNDTLVNYKGTNVSMDGGQGNDTLYNIYGSNVIMNGGADKDEFINNGDYVTITGEDGNDIINSVPLDSVNKYIKIYGGGGDDEILSAGEETTIYGGSGNDNISNMNETAGNVVIFGETGNDKITNKGNNAKIYGGEDDDTIGNTGGCNVKIDGGKGNDSIANTRGSNVKIDGGEGNDTIGNGGSSVTITGGNGDDIILTVPFDENVNNHVEIFGGGDNDIIISDSEEVTIHGGTGNDRIILYGNAKNNLIEYKTGDGTDLIEGFNATSTLSISGGEYSTQESGNDVLVKVGNSSIWLKDAKGQALSIIGKQKTETPPADTTPADTTPADTTPADTTPADTTPADTTPADTTPASINLTITNTDKTTVTVGSDAKVVDASSRTKTVKITGNDLNNTIIGGTKNDTLNGGAGDDKLTGGKGNDVFIYDGGNDTITDYASGDKISLNASIKSFGASGNDFVFNFEDGSLTLTDAADKKISLTSGKVTNVYSDKGIFNTAGTAVTLNASATNYTADKTVVTIDAGLTSGVEITGNTKANKILLGDGDDVVIWLAKGGNDTLYNFGADDLLSVVGAVSDGSVKSGNTYLKIGSNKITVKDSSQVTFADNDGTRIFDGGIFYDENKISATLGSAVKEFDSTDTDVVDITGNDKANKFVAGNEDTTLTGGKGNDTFVHTGGNDFITDYGNGSDKISLGAATIENFSVTDGNVKLDLDKGSITIANGAGKKISLVSGKKTTANIFTGDGIFDTSGKSVTLNASTETFTADSKVVTIDASSTSGATITGNSKANKVYLGDENIFVWSQGGNDTLMNFGADDLLSVVGAVSDGSISGGNTYLKIGSNKITVKDSSQVTFADNDGTKIFDGGIFYDTEKTSATLASATKDFDATDTEIISVTGNDKANKLYAGDENTTLAGGKGNDSLWGGNGADTFLYDKGDGKDIIYGFGDNDMFEIRGLDGIISGTTDGKGDIAIKVGTTAVATFKDFSATNFNINGDVYRLNGKNLTK